MNFDVKWSLSDAFTFVPGTSLHHLTNGELLVVATVICDLHFTVDFVEPATHGFPIKSSYRWFSRRPKTEFGCVGTIAPRPAVASVRGKGNPEIAWKKQF